MMNPSSSTTATVNASKPTPAQCQVQHADDDEDKEVFDSIPYNDDSSGSEQETVDKDKDELPSIWKANEFWDYVYFQLEELCDKICNLLLKKSLQDEKFTEYVHAIVSVVQ